jgi:phage recombination protein Bet
MSNALVVKFAERFSVDKEAVLSTLKNTCFKGQVSDSQMTALMIVADQYGLNPFTKEIYAFPDKNNGIVPVVGVDGWSRIINENAQFDGMDFKSDDESCTCTIYRKDRNHPIQVTEYMSECKRAAGPWQSHPKRMLRHKAMIQCARLAFGYVGIYDQDEAERIAEIKDINPRQRQNAAVIAQQMNEIPSSPERDKLIADLEALIEEQGQEAYAIAFENMTKEERQMLGAEEHQRIWAMGEKND